MGNKLCAPLLKKNYRGNDSNLWHRRKDSHLVRLWADVLRVHGYGEYMRWERVSDDVVPVNISCIQDTPTTVFHITAYNSQVERIFDVKIQQPGTLICPATECFVHWRDITSHCQWGLNFSTATDAKTFRDTCSFPAQGFVRKASSTSTLGFSPPQWLQNRPTSASSPSSPVQLGCHITSDARENYGCEHTQGLTVIPAANENTHFSICGSSINPSSQSRSWTLRGRLTFSDSALILRQKPNVSNDQVTIVPSIDSRNPAFRRSCPTRRREESSDFAKTSLPSPSNLQDMRPGQDEAEDMKAKTTKVSFITNTAGAWSCNSLNTYRESGEDPNRIGSTPACMDPNLQPASIVSDMVKQKTSSPKHVQISDIVSVSLTDVSLLSKPAVINSSQNKPSSIFRCDNSLKTDAEQASHPGQNHTSFVVGNDLDSQITFLSASLPRPLVEELPIKLPQTPLIVDTDLSVSQSQHTPSYESVEWPSPPEPLTPQTPLTPSAPSQMSFDSDTIRKMLRSLPSSPMDSNYPYKTDPSLHEHLSLQKNNRTDFTLREQSNKTDASHTNVLQYQQQQQHVDRRESRLSRKKNLNVDDRITNSNCHPHRQQSTEVSSSNFKVDATRSRTFNKLALERELRKRNKSTAATRPDIGLGMPTDTASTTHSKGSSSFIEICKHAGQDPKLCSGGAGTGSGTSDCSEIIREFKERAYIVKEYLSTDLSEDESSDESIDAMTEIDSQVSCNWQVGAIRKAGWLFMKNWLLHKKKKVYLAPCRTWKYYWVCLKGTALLFFDSDEESSVTENSMPKHLLVIGGGIAQVVPEHPKKDNIFSLSTAYGDAYLFQASSQIDLEKWIRAIHSACASSYARQYGKDKTLKLLCSELQKLESNIDLVVKMQNMVELQMSVVTDPKSQKAVSKQIAHWEENLEKLHIDQYRIQCYSASLQGSELPNPKGLLANASRASKATLGHLGIFTVTSFHALVAARKPLVLPNIYCKTSHKGGMLSPSSESIQNHRPVTSTALVSSSVSTEGLFKTEQVSHSDSTDSLLENPGNDSSSAEESLSKVILPDNKLMFASEIRWPEAGKRMAENRKLMMYAGRDDGKYQECYNFQTMLIEVDKGTSIQNLLEITCSKKQLNSRDHYVRIKPLGSTDNTFVIPDKHENVKKLCYDAIEVCQKCIFQLELTKSTKNSMFGFAVEAELAEDKGDELRVSVCDVTKNSVADNKSLMVGDEILVINGKIVSELDMVYIETLLHELQTLFLTVRSTRTQPPPSDFIQRQTDIYIDNMMVPPPPTQPRLSDRSIGCLIVPAPDDVDSSIFTSSKDKVLQSYSPTQIDVLLESAQEVTAICRKDEIMNISTEEDSTINRSLSDAQRMRKAIMELVETERAYVKDLKCATEHYLEPLKEETFLTSGKIEQLFGNIQEIVAFQQRFMYSLEEAVESVPDFFTTNDVTDFKKVLFSVGGSFLYYANHFKVYSSFCASHSRSQKILNPDTNIALREFLRARNPKQQHSATLESYLIKPIQRILKYPLLLQQLCNMTDASTDEHHHISEAHKGMEAVAEHINEMQKIYDEYGTVFDELAKSYKENNPHKTPIELNVGDLQMYGTVEWVNVTDHIGKVKKSAEFENIVFVFKTGITILCRERLKKKKAKPVSTKSSMAEVTETIERYRILIPTQELQVRTGKVSDMDQHYWWDLVHSRSEVEGRPEKCFHFCNSTGEAKSDFMKVIRQTIRESVRKMIIPSSSSSSYPHYHPHSSNTRPYFSSSTSQNPPPLSESSSLENGGYTISPCQSSTPSPLSRSQLLLFKRHMKSLDTEMHSVDVDSKITDTHVGLQTRRKTIGDLNEVSMDESRRFVTGTLEQATVDRCKESGSCSSNSNPNCSSLTGSQTGSVKLQSASTDQLHYSFLSVRYKDRSRATSPVWKKAEEKGKIKSNQQNEENIKSGISDGDSSNNSAERVSLQQDTTVVFAPVSGDVPVLKDTEC